MNIILSECQERVFSTQAPVQVEAMGCYFIRGDNIAIVGEIEEALEVSIDYSKMKAAPIKPMLIH